MEVGDRLSFTLVESTFDLVDKHAPTPLVFYGFVHIVERLSNVLAFGDDDPVVPPGDQYQPGCNWWNLGLF